MGRRILRSSLPSTGSAAWRRRSRWMARISAIRRWAARRSRTSTWMRWRRFVRVGVDAGGDGRGASGFTNIITRSGASGFHGSFFEFLRNSALDARNYFDHPTPAYPGGFHPFGEMNSASPNGGPVMLPHVYDGRKKTYYFDEYQGFRQVLGTTQVMPVPTAADRAGTRYDDVSGWVYGYADGAVDPAIAGDSGAVSAAEHATGPFGTNTYATASKVVTNADQFSVRIDHRFRRRTSSWRGSTTTT